MHNTLTTRAPMEGRTPLEQAIANLENAERAILMLPATDGPYVPCPSVVAVSEIRNAMAYLKQI